MSIQTINTGSGPNAGDGDSIRSAFHKINNNFAEVVSSINTNTILPSSKYNIAYYDNTGSILTGIPFFNVDPSTQRLHLGEGNISGGINIIRNTTVLGFTPNQLSANIHIADYHPNNDVSNLEFFRARGSENSPQSVQINDEIAELVFLAHNGTTATVAGAFGVVVEQEPTINGVASKYVFRVSTGSSVLRKAAEISSSATWKINKLGHLSTTTSTIEVTGDMIPSLDLTYDLGSTSSQWRSLYVGTSTIYIGGKALSVTPAGDITVDGNTVSGGGTTLSNGTATLSISTLSETVLPSGLTFTPIENYGFGFSGTLATQTYGEQLQVLATGTGAFGLFGWGEVIGGPGGVAYIVANQDGTNEVKIVAGSYTATVNTWEFNSLGELNLPQGGAIQETQVTNELWGTTTTSLTLVPGGAANGTQRLEIYSTGGGEGNHIHIRSGNQTQTDLFLGNDTQYFAVGANGSNYIGTNDGTTSRLWTFNNLGQIIFPDGSTQTTAYGFVSPPVSSTSTGVAGSLAQDASYFYVCTATNAWQRIAWDNTPW